MVIKMMKKHLISLTCSFLAVLLFALAFSGCGGADYSKQFAAPSKGDTMAKIHTTMGDVTIRLFKKEAPKAVENFVTHAKEGYYDNTLFFRVISDFMIQGGDAEDNIGTGGFSIWGGPFEDEVCPYLSTYRGALCMANRGPDTNSSQFFIVTRGQQDMGSYKRVNLEVESKYRVSDEKLKAFAERGGAPHLDYQLSLMMQKAYPDSAYKQYFHTVFGQVVEGMDIVDAISNVKTYGEKEINEAKILYGSNQTQAVLDKPMEDVMVESIEIYTYQG